MTSEAMPTPDRAYVWIWLPGAVAPVVAGLLQRDSRGGYGFVYGRSYLGRDDAISLFPSARVGVRPHWRPRFSGLAAQ